MLFDGRLALSPISAVAYAQHAQNFVLLPDLCIGARREVLSVLLVSEVAPALLDGATVAVTSESASGAALLRVLLEGKYGVRARFQDDDDPLSTVLRTQRPALLIGERAIDARVAIPAEHLYDLGSLWNEWTGEDSVFAVWAARRDVFERDPDSVAACMAQFRAAYLWGTEHRQEIISQAEKVRARPPGFYEEYYEKLNFKFDGAAQRGLQRFFGELLAIGLINNVPVSEPEVSGVSG